MLKIIHSTPQTTLSEHILLTSPTQVYQKRAKINLAFRETRTLCGMQTRKERGMWDVSV